MDELTTVFRFDRISHLHHTRTQTIHRIVGRDNNPPATARTCHGSLAYAIAHHYLEGAEHAAREHDCSTFDWYRRHLNTPPAFWFEHAPDKPTIIQSLTPSDLRTSPIAETPYHLLGPTTVAAPSAAVNLAKEALAIAATFGFNELVTDHAPIVCLLVARNLEETLNSWTISRLPGTVFLDHANAPAILARDIIHEAAHNWLNDALIAASVVIDDNNTYYSPWKGRTRPAFGFLHACWAFPLTMIFAAQAADHTAKPIRAVLNMYLAQQREKLVLTTSDHARAVNGVSDKDLRQRLRAVYAQAQEL